MNSKRSTVEPIRQPTLFDLQRSADADLGKDSAWEIREYFIPDFSNWKNHDAYQKAFEQLMRDLKAEDHRAARRSGLAIRMDNFHRARGRNPLGHRRTLLSLIYKNRQYLFRAIRSFSVVQGQTWIEAKTRLFSGANPDAPSNRSFSCLAKPEVPVERHSTWPAH